MVIVVIGLEGLGGQGGQNVQGVMVVRVVMMVMVVMVVRALRLLQVFVTPRQWIDHWRLCGGGRQALVNRDKSCSIKSPPPSILFDTPVSGMCQGGHGDQFGQVIIFCFD